MTRYYKTRTIGYHAGCQKWLVVAIAGVVRTHNYRDPKSKTQKIECEQQRQLLDDYDDLNNQVFAVPSFAKLPALWLILWCENGRLIQNFDSEGWGLLEKGA